MKEKNVSNKSRSELPPQLSERLIEAEKDYRKLWDEIKPFHKKRVTRKYSTTGKWVASSCETRG